jgi:hypothetical protein
LAEGDKVASKKAILLMKQISNEKDNNNNKNNDLTHDFNKKKTSKGRGRNDFSIIQVNKKFVIREPSTDNAIQPFVEIGK